MTLEQAGKAACADNQPQLDWQDRLADEPAATPAYVTD